MESAAEKNQLGHETDEKHDCDRSQRQAEADVSFPQIVFAFIGRHESGVAFCFTQPITRVAVASRRGGFSKV